MGATLRLAQYLGRASLGLDEARLALNVGTRSWAGLLRPLDYDQAAPPLFLWLEKAATLIGGMNELALRFPAIAAGILCIPLLYVVARRVASDRVGLIAAAVAAFSPLLIRYSVESKPYGLDLAVALGLLYLGLQWSDAPASERAGMQLAAAGTIAVWVSAPAVFVLAGITGALWFGPPTTRPSRSRLGWVGATWAASFLVVYLLVYRSTAANPYMRQYWGEALLTVWRPGAPWRAWQGTRDVVWQLFFGGGVEPPMPAAKDLTVSVGTVAILVLLAVGSWHLIRTDRQRWLFVTGPLAAAVGASTVDLYPIAGRLMLFAAPSLFILAAASSMSPAPQSSPKSLPWVASFALLVLLLPPLKRDFLLATHPTAFEHVRPAVSEFHSLAMPGEPIYVFTGSLPAWTFYTTDWANPDLERLRRAALLGSAGGPAFENAPPRGRRVGGENDSLIFAVGGTREILGAATGAQRLLRIGPVQFEPDAGWAAAEAHRMRAAANRGVWLLASHTFGLEQFLYPEIERMGGRLEHAYERDDVILRRYQFP
jgi:hypothetical protein